MEAKLQEDGKIVMPHFVLVDDDPIFAKLLEKVAASQRVRLTTFCYPSDAYRELPNLDFDVAIIDYDLGRVTGVQLCQYLERLHRKVPVLLVSHLPKIESRGSASDWIFRALNKGAGPYSILVSAIGAHQQRKRKEG